MGWSSLSDNSGPCSSSPQLPLSTQLPGNVWNNRLTGSWVLGVSGGGELQGPPLTQHCQPAQGWWEWRMCRRMRGFPGAQSEGRERRGLVSWYGSLSQHTKRGRELLQFVLTTLNENHKPSHLSLCKVLLQVLFIFLKSDVIFFSNSCVLNVLYSGRALRL